MERKNIAICAIAYNRVHSLARLLNSLNAAYYPHEVELVISIDKSDSNEVPAYAENFDWKHGSKKVIRHKENLGLRKHVLSCGDLLLAHYDALIVLEDDVSVAQSFYYFAEKCVEKYSDDENIAGISLYNFPINPYSSLPFHPLHSDSDVFLMQIAMSWGQVWMKEQWRRFRNWYDGHNEEFSVMPHLPVPICNWPKSSWLKYHDRYCIEQNKYFVYPYEAFSTDNSDTGSHNKVTCSYFQSHLFYGKKTEFNLNPQVTYDGFFENVKLPEYLILDADNVCIDIYGHKKNRENLRYWLTCTHEPYKIVKSFALSLKPVEYNVIQNLEGHELFLYDTSMSQKSRRRNVMSLIRSYFYATDMYVSHQVKREIISRFRHLFN